MPIRQVEMNTIITFLGMLCATVQFATGFYAAYIRRRSGLLKGNDILHRAHRTFGGFVTVLYLLGLFAGVNGLIGALTRNEPPLELRSASFAAERLIQHSHLGIVPGSRGLDLEDLLVLFQQETPLHQAQVAGHCDVYRLDV